jgi:DNA-directed RNA polymerase subunit RPC12/RpoP
MKKGQKKSVTSSKNTNMKNNNIATVTQTVNNASSDNMGVKISIHKSDKVDKKYNCKYCNNIFSSRQSKWRHIKICNKKTELETRIEKIELKINNKFVLETEQVIELLNIEIIKIKKTFDLISVFPYTRKLHKDTIQLAESIIKKSFETYNILINSIDVDLLKTNIKNIIKSNQQFIKDLSKFDEFISYECIQCFNKLKLIELDDKKFIKQDDKKFIKQDDKKTIKLDNKKFDMYNSENITVISDYESDSDTTDSSE